MIRAAMSIPANIVEGREQKSEREFGRFLQYAISSTSELEYHLITARDMNTLGQTDFLSLLSDLIEVRKMLHGLLDRLKMDKARQEEKLSQESRKKENESRPLVGG